MRDFPSCFGENGVQVSDASSSSNAPPPPPPPATATATAKTAQNLVTCVYQCKLHNSSCFIITITWAKTLMGQHLSVQIDNPTTLSLCKLEIKPSLFSKKRGFRTLETGSNSFEFFWDLSSAKFNSSPEPIESFYFAITVNQQLILLLGDMEKEVHKKMNNNGSFNSSSLSSSSPNSIFISKKEHIFGKKSYTTTAQFCGKGQIHEILIECDTINTNDPFLLIRIDGKIVMKVKQLRWKFRGNYTILVDGLPVEVYWDVYSWFFGKLIGGNGVFMFQTCLSAEKLWGSSAISWSRSLINNKDCVESHGLGFSLVLYVWKNE